MTADHTKVSGLSYCLKHTHTHLLPSWVRVTIGYSRRGRDNHLTLKQFLCPLTSHSIREPLSFAPDNHLVSGKQCSTTQEVCPSRCHYNHQDREKASYLIPHAEEELRGNFWTELETYWKEKIWNLFFGCRSDLAAALNHQAQNEGYPTATSSTGVNLSASPTQFKKDQCVIVKFYFNSCHILPSITAAGFHLRCVAPARSDWGHTHCIQCTIYRSAPPARVRPQTAVWLISYDCYLCIYVCFKGVGKSSERFRRHLFSIWKT